MAVPEHPGGDKRFEIFDGATKRQQCQVATFYHLFSSKPLGEHACVVPRLSTENGACPR